MLDYVAEQIGADTEAIARFARREATRYEQLAAIKHHHGYRDFTRLARSVLNNWAEHEALGLTDGCVLLGRLIEKMREERIVIPGVTVVERLAASALHTAEGRMVTKVCSLLDEGHRHQLDALLVVKTYARQTRLSWLREPPSRVGARPLIEILDKIAIVRSTLDGIVFAVMHLLGLSFEPRIPRLSDRKLYAFEPKARYGPLAPLFGNRLNSQLIRSHWDEIQRVIHALRHKVVTPSLILRKLSAYRQQNSLAAALREIGRIERTLFTLRWFEVPGLRRLVTTELNKAQ